MRSLAGDALAAVRLYAARHEVTVHELLQLLASDEAKRWPPVLRVRLIQALFDGLPLNDLPNLSSLAPQLSPFEQGLLGYKLGWLHLDPFRCGGCGRCCSGIMRAMLRRDRWTYSARPSSDVAQGVRRVGHPAPVGAQGVSYDVASV